ncbi:MAG: hypothetical protein AB7F88_18255 [Pyrinomonadaceae bacterium]
MKITIDSKAINFGDRRFTFNLYFLEDGSEFLAPSSGATFKNIVIRWAEVLRTINSENSPMFLPYDADDQWTDALKATLVAGRIELRWVRLAEGGWGVFDYDLAGFIASAHKVTEESDELLGEFNKDQIVSALIHAEVIEELF